MPRGIRKRSQYTYTIWTPKGGRIQEYTTRDLSRQEFIDDLRKAAERLKLMADNLEKNGDA